jgi:SAM-dependent methyltransferase
MSPRGGERMECDDGLGDWRSYDGVADVYERAAVPQFTNLARDLVAAVTLPARSLVLDIGTGTGLVAKLLAESIEPPRLVVGVDPSVGMLARAIHERIARVAARVPGLPSRTGVFDAVLANLVLSHIVEYEASLAETCRVLRAGGQFAGSAWGPAVPASPEHQAAQADAVIEEVAARHGVDVAPPTPAVPSEDRLRERENLERALLCAGFDCVAVVSHTYDWTYSIDQYLERRAWGPASRYRRQRVGEQAWQAFSEAARDALHDRFETTIRTRGEAWIAVGSKP